MTKVGYSNQGTLPSHKFIASSDKPANAPKFSGAEQLSYPLARAAKQQAWSRMSRGGNFLNHFTDSTVPLFQKITEVYIASFLAQDVIGLWMPRIWTSAKTGRVEYDPSKDPEAKDKPFKEQVKLWIKGNFKGLNWVNLQEETAREAATGPGLLVIPSVLYAFSSRKLSKSGIHLRHEALNGLCDGFREHLEASHLRQTGADLKLKAYRREMGNYIASIFKDAEMRKAAMPGGGTYGEFLDDWSQRWANAMDLGKDKAARKAQEAKLTQLSAELQTKLVAFNQEHRLQPYSMNGKAIGEKASDSLLHRVDHIWTSYGKNEAAHNSISQVLKDLSKWTDVASGIYKTQAEKLAGVADVKLPEVVEFVRRKVISHKALFGITATALGTAYLFQLVFWTQRHKSYEATRLLHEDKKGAQPPQAAPNQPASQPGGYVQTNQLFNIPAFPLNTQGSQPVFSISGNNRTTNQPGVPGGQA